MATKQSRCWPGYEPVKGKKQHEQGSCRPKAESKTSGDEKKFRAARRKQLDKWEAEHPKSRKSASQHLHAPGAETETPRAKKKSAPKATSQRKATKKAAANKAAAKKSAPKKSASR